MAGSSKDSKELKTRQGRAEPAREPEQGAQENPLKKARDFVKKRKKWFFVKEWLDVDNLSTVFSVLSSAASSFKGIVLGIRDEDQIDREHKPQKSFKQIMKEEGVTDEEVDRQAHLHYVQSWFFLFCAAMMAAYIAYAVKIGSYFVAFVCIGFLAVFLGMACRSRILNYAYRHRISRCDFKTWWNSEDR